LAAEAKAVKKNCQAYPKKARNKYLKRSRKSDRLFLGGEGV